MTLIKNKVINQKMKNKKKHLNTEITEHTENYPSELILIFSPCSP